MKWDDYKKDIKSLTEEEILYIEFLANIVTKRKDKGLTQRDMEKITGLKQSAIARLESPSGQSAPNLLTVIKYLNGLGLKLEVKEK